jgi:hypothetical protein
MIIIVVTAGIQLFPFNQGLGRDPKELTNEQRQHSIKYITLIHLLVYTSTVNCYQAV